MDNKDVPPPYEDGFNNQGYGQPYMATAPPHHYAPQPVAAQPQLSHTSNTNTTVVLGSGTAGGCPMCHNGSWTGTYSCCAWLCCIFCFPCGIICCLCMRKKKCTKCGFTVA